MLNDGCAQVTEDRDLDREENHRLFQIFRKSLNGFISKPIFNYFKDRKLIKKFLLVFDDKIQYGNLIQQFSLTWLKAVYENYWGHR